MRMTGIICLMMFLMFIWCYFNIGQDDLDSIFLSFMVKFDGCRVSRGFDMFAFAWEHDIWLPRQQVWNKFPMDSIQSPTSLVSATIILRLNQWFYFHFLCANSRFAFFNSQVFAGWHWEKLLPLASTLRGICLGQLKKFFRHAMREETQFPGWAVRVDSSGEGEDPSAAEPGSSSKVFGR